MDTEIITIYCICDNFIKALGLKQDPQLKMSHAEIATIALVAGKYFQGNIQASTRFLRDYKYMSNILSKSQLSRRLHALPGLFWHVLLTFLARLKGLDKSKDVIVDSFPIPACHAVRMSRCKIFKESAYLGFNSAKDTYYKGLKVHMILSLTGQPLKFRITAASIHDLTAFKKMNLGFLKGAKIYADKAYTDFKLEDRLREEGILLMPQRKENSSRQWGYHTYLGINRLRKRIETYFSQIATFLPRRIVAVTPNGFILKIHMAIAAFALHLYLK